MTTRTRLVVAKLEPGQDPATTADRYSLCDTTGIRPATFSLLARPFDCESRPAVVAHGVRFLDGYTLIRWRAGYSRGGRVNGGNPKEIGETLDAIEGLDEVTLRTAYHNEHWQRGADNALQDRCEGCLWASLRPGGKGTQGDPCPVQPVLPDYIDRLHGTDYLAGYIETAEALIGRSGFSMGTAEALDGD